MGTTEDRHTIRITGIECIPATTVIICIKPRWAQSARFDEIIFWLAFEVVSERDANLPLHTTGEQAQSLSF